MKTYRLIKIEKPGVLHHYVIQRRTWFGWFTILCEVTFDEVDAIATYNRYIKKNEPTVVTVIASNEYHSPRD